MTKPNNCRHENIYWEDLFKPEKDFDNKIYCLDCGETKGQKFAIATKKWYHKKLEDWLKENNLAEKKFSRDGEEYYFFSDWIKFIQKNSYEEVWSNFCRGKIDPDYFESLLGQGLFFEFAKSIEYLCQEFKKQKQNSPDKPSSPKNKEKISELKAKIKELETKLNKTSEEEAELTDKQEQLDKLTKPTNNEQNDSNSRIKPALIISGVIVLVGLVVMFLTKNKKNKH